MPVSFVVIALLYKWQNFNTIVFLSVELACIFVKMHLWIHKFFAFLVLIQSKLFFTVRLFIELYGTMYMLDFDLGQS